MEGGDAEDVDIDPLAHEEVNDDDLEVGISIKNLTKIYGDVSCSYNNGPVILSLVIRCPCIFAVYLLEALLKRQPKS